MNIYNLFDLLGLAIWIFLFLDGFFDYKKKKNWRAFLRILIGLGGFIIDLSLTIFGP